MTLKQNCPTYQDDGNSSSQNKSKAWPRKFCSWVHWNTSSEESVQKSHKIAALCINEVDLGSRMFPRISRTNIVTQFKDHPNITRIYVLFSNIKLKNILLFTSSILIHILGIYYNICYTMHI